MKSSLVFALCFASLGWAYSSSLRIVNGDEVAENSIPYQAHIELITDFLQSWNCTGVLVTGRYVLTTSKCQWSGPTHVKVRLGAHNISQVESTEQSFYTGKYWKVYHENFTYYTLENNIALVRLPSTAALNEYVQAAELPSVDDVKVGQSGTISGWGVEAEKPGTVLQSATATIVENSVCAAAYGEFYTGETTICVQGDNGASACDGDGGAPLVIDGVVVGIFSGGPVYTADSNCTGKPNIFTKVASFMDWIKDNSDVN